MTTEKMRVSASSVISSVADMSATPASCLTADEVDAADGVGGVDVDGVNEVGVQCTISNGQVRAALASASAVGSAGAVASLGPTGVCRRLGCLGRAAGAGAIRRIPAGRLCQAVVVRCGDLRRWCDALPSVARAILS